ncbi:GNAT superfamily N-acetyltransferase [Methanohalophilus levihalophilus]|uniref:GNAT family N-acetyltransferase n=1 Tax=Methanohalophilus levihalophilus TaxID=1431282 RepID=UPI001AEA74B5|nr:GNAT family N-acetyltransferase [Methanohalophilus levihalophilus]MBP2030310.1 GNAT superfamily N-acetyltransferase [Methanohalophilus levihalophilus]
MVNSGMTLSEKMARCKEAIEAAREICVHPSLLQYLNDCRFALASKRFSGGSSVAYAYEAEDAVYILLIFSRIKHRGDGSRLIKCIIEYAREMGYDKIYVTTSP